MKLRPYPEYKNSGVEWLGEVPSDWDVSRLCFEAWIRARLGWKGLKAEEYVDDGYVLLATPNIKGSEIDFENVNYISEERYEESPEIKIAVGDVLLAKDGSTLGTVNVVRTLPKPATVNSSIAVISPQSRVDSVFLYFLFQSTFMDATIQRIKGGMGVPHLFQEDLNKFYLPVPSLSEQSAIATFLDRETAKIDALIAEQEKLIELLREKRQAGISHAVTKGLNPTAPMKDSGIEWLGEVPAHWGVVPLKRDLEFLTSGSRGWAEHYADDGALFIRIGNLTRDSISLDLSDIQRVAVPEGAEGERTRLQEGDVLFSITAYLGSVAVVPEDMEAAYVSQHVALARLRQQRFLPPWVALVTLSYVGKTYLGTQGYGGTKIQLSLDDVASAIMTCPPLDEQAAIVTHLHRATTELDTLMAEAQRAIDLLKTRRAALISAAVTGKIDVRRTSAEIIQFTPRQRRNILAAEVISVCHLDHTFGRTKAQKAFYLLERHLGVEEMDGRYERYVYGPYDGQQLDSIASDLESAEWFREVPMDGRSIYRPLAKADEVGGLFERAWGGRRAEIGKLIGLLRPLDTQEAEVIATLFAAWNDFLLEGQTVNDDTLITDVRTNWHPSKLSISIEKWHWGLRWMRENNVIPRGVGRPTIYQTSLL